VALALLTGAGQFHKHQFSNPASRGARMPAAFLLRPCSPR
jgi:hypothetical protein